MSAVDLNIAVPAEGSASWDAEFAAFLAWLAGSDHVSPVDLGAACLSESAPAVGEPASADGAADWAQVQAAIGGDGEAYAVLVRRYQRPIAAYLWRFTRDRTAWEELVHDVFVEAYFALAGYRCRAPLLHWLKRIATRVGYRYWKQRRQRQERQVPWTDNLGDDMAAPDSTDAARDAAELVHRLLAQLAPRDRLVLTLMYLEECTVAEISQLTGWSEVLVKVQAHRARQRLRKLWAQRSERR